MEIFSTLGNNPYFGAGFGLFGVGALAALGRKASNFAVIALKRHCITTLEVPCNDKCYNWILDWITKRGNKSSQHLSVRTFYDETDSGKINTKYNLVPSIGTHYFKHKDSGAWIKIDRIREQHQQDIIGGTPWEFVTLSSIGKKKELFLKIIEEAREEALKKQAGKTITYSYVNNEWRQSGKAKLKRPIKSVILKEGLSDLIVKDVQEFIQSGDWYKDRGIPYRRGYLLYGPPGCGKTSFIFALAGHLDFSISVLNLADQTLTDENLNQRLSEVPENSIVLLEDVDAAFISREHVDNKSNTAFQGINRLTFSGLLNALDGVTSSEVRIVFMTTNHIEHLDSALIRPGRIDFQEEISYCTKEQIVQLFQNFYPQASGDDAESFARKIMDENGKLSPAKIQSIFLLFKNYEKLRTCDLMSLI